MLTRKQKELLTFMCGYFEKEGVVPSFDEMKEAVALNSKSGIHRLVLGLEERGYLRRVPHRARALEIIRKPDDVGKNAGSPPFSSSAKEGAGGFSLPLYGRIAAGTPIEALNEPQEHIDIPSALVAGVRGGVAAPHYALEVAGDSMIEAGIMDGDRIIIRSVNTANNGAIVVALIDDHEATLKYFERRKENIALIPANKNYETRLLNPQRVKIQGVLVGLLRRY